MLRCYPIEASHENWLHESIVSLIRDIHQKLDRSDEIQNNQEAWKALLLNCVDIEEPNGQILETLPGIRDRFFSYKDELANLTSRERQIILDVMDCQNSIEALLNGVGPVQVINLTYPDLHEKAKDLFIFCFKKLTDLKIRESQYQIIFDYLDDKICSFCGIERVMNPEETAQDQDHYLAKSIYPFAAANMRNLVPMCRCCNRDYKQGIDVIKGEDGTRRKAFDPYNCNPVQISLEHTTIVPDSFPIKFEWEIEFLPALEESETWDKVFSIRKRYKRDVLNQYFDRWLRGVTSKCLKDRQRRVLSPNLTDVQVRQYLAVYQEDKADNPSIGVGGFLEPLVFQFLLSKFDQGDNRIVSLIKDAVLGVSCDDVA